MSEPWYRHLWRNTVRRWVPTKITTLDYIDRFSDFLSEDAYKDPNWDGVGYIKEIYTQLPADREKMVEALQAIILDGWAKPFPVEKAVEIALWIQHPKLVEAATFYQKLQGAFEQAKKQEFAPNPREGRDYSWLDDIDEQGGEDWRDMASAPRDGTIIEIKSTYGVTPWYGYFRWTTEALAYGPHGTAVMIHTDAPKWVYARDPRQGIASGENTLRWRPATTTKEK